MLVAGDKYVNFALLMLMDVPANVLYWLVLINSRRKTSLLVSFLVGGAFCTIQPFVPDSTYKMIWIIIPNIARL